MLGDGRENLFARRSRSTPWPNEELICTNTLVLRSAHRARPCGIEGGANDIQQFAVVRRFLQESGGARFQRALAIELRIARGQDNYGNRRERGALLQTIEHNEAVPAGRPISRMMRSGRSFWAMAMAEKPSVAYDVS